MKVWLVLFGILLELDHTLVRVLLQSKHVQKMNSKPRFMNKGKTNTSKTSSKSTVSSTVNRQEWKMSV